MTVSTASRVLIPASRRAHRFAPSEIAATRSAVLLARITARADEHLAPAPGTQKHPGIVNRSPRRGGLDDPRSPGNAALGAVRKCGSGRSLGRDRQVSGVRGCAGLPGPCDLTATPQRRHRTGARRRHSGSATSVQVGSTSRAGSPGRFNACSVALRRSRQDLICTIYPHFSVAENMGRGVVHQPIAQNMGQHHQSRPAEEGHLAPPASTERLAANSQPVTSCLLIMA